MELPNETVRLVGHAETRPLQQSGESAQQSMVVELDVNVEYTAGCQRSHAARMAVPVTEPMRYLPIAQLDVLNVLQKDHIEEESDWVPSMQGPSPPLECLTSNTAHIHPHSTQVSATSKRF